MTEKVMILQGELFKGIKYLDPVEVNDYKRKGFSVLKVVNGVPQKPL